METDITSIIIGLVSLATFFVPIGYYELHEKMCLNDARRQFLKKADEIGFQTGEIEILRNRTAMGIGKNHEQLLYVRGNQYEMIELKNVVDCEIYKNQKKNPDSGDGITQQIGIRLKLHKGLEKKLPIFEGKEGLLFGDEQLIVHHWIGKIKSAFDKLGTIVTA